jgi:hypothetical protein
MLIDITWKFQWATTATKKVNSRETVSIWMCQCFVPSDRVYLHLPNVPWLAQFTLMQWRNSSCLFRRKRFWWRASNKMGYSAFSQGSDGLLKSQISTEMNWQGRTNHMATSFAWLFPVGCLLWRYIKGIEYILPLGTTVPKLSGLIRAAVVGIGLDFPNNARTETGCKYVSWTLMVPSGNTCISLSQRLDHTAY